MIWARILMTNGMRYDFPLDILKESRLIKKSGLIHFQTEDGRKVLLNSNHIVSIEVDKGET